MKEILGAELGDAFAELGITPKKTYELKNKPWDYCEIYQVWELSIDDFKRLCSLKEEDWKDNWGWWRSAEGSNLGGVTHRYNINNHYIKAWDGDFRKQKIEENKRCKPEDRHYEERKYKTLLEYFCGEIGASTEKNICALAVGLAQQNRITMGELFKKYQD